MENYELLLLLQFSLPFSHLAHS